MYTAAYKTILSDFYPRIRAGVDANSRTIAYYRTEFTRTGFDSFTLNSYFDDFFIES